MIRKAILLRDLLWNTEFVNFSLSFFIDFFISNTYYIVNCGERRKFVSLVKILIISGINSDVCITIKTCKKDRRIVHIY